MGFFGFVFWMVVLWFAYRWWRGSGRKRAGGSSLHSGWYDSGEFDGRRNRKLIKARREEIEDQEAYIESLERRVSELEERLDFTERLLAERREPVEM
jgi:hypothetical protein